jgi:ABC-type phosphate transport system permease subunit
MLVGDDMRPSRTIRAKPKSRYVMNIISSIVMIIVGAIISIPFIIDVLILDHNYHYITFWPFMRFIGLLIGAPMIVFGIIALLVRKHRHGSSSTASIDLARIRYTVENDSRNK